MPQWSQTSTEQEVVAQARICHSQCSLNNVLTLGHKHSQECCELCHGCAITISGLACLTEDDMEI